MSDASGDRECDFQESLDDGAVRCGICPHTCRIAEGQTGICLCRRNVGGRLRPLNYGEVTSAAMDPIEKKPLYHFLPGRDILSLGTWGCNFKCDFCQNWQISQQQAATQPMSPEEAVTAAQEQGSCGIAYTYNEPTIWFEYVRDTGRLAREAGLKNVLVTNGFINAEPLAALLDEVVDAMNIDLKSFRDAYYRRHAKGRLSPVLETIRTAAARCHVETTTLLVPGENDSDAELAELRDWLADTLGPDSPVHLSAYFPRYRLQASATPLAALMRGREILGERLNFVYLGNVMASGAGNTECPDCGATAVRRSGYRVETSGLAGGSCAACGRALGIVAE
jgi:pyruvate formate lyase activating enzyme